MRRKGVGMEEEVEEAEMMMVAERGKGVRDTGMMMRMVGGTTV